MKETDAFEKPPASHRLPGVVSYIGAISAGHKGSRFMLSWRCAAVVAAVLISPAAFGETRLPVTVVELAGHAVRAEVAADDRSRMRGLMHREGLGENEGMVFVFEGELPLSFWMKNTLIPLDILYFDGEGRLVSVQRDVPPCRTAFCPSYPSEGPARYVLELNAGRAKALGVKAGMRLCEQQPKNTPLPACSGP